MTTAPDRRPHETHEEHYEHYGVGVIARLDEFYGQVEAEMNRRITTHVEGRTVLDIGCGFGSLVAFLAASGLDAKGVDTLDSWVEAGRERFPGVDLRVSDRYSLGFPDKSFDTVVMKEVIHHIADESDPDRFLAEVRRVCRKRLIVFDPNPTVFLGLARRILRHFDPVCSPGSAAALLTEAGFTVRLIEYSESIAYLLSGGYVSGLRLSRPPRAVAKALLAIDRFLVAVLRWTGLARFSCWRYLLVADLDPADLMRL